MKAKRLYTALLLAFAAVTAYGAVGDTFYETVSEPNGQTRMMFTILDGNKVTVGNGYSACVSYLYSGPITIPATVTHDGVAYTVSEINKLAFYLCNLVTEVTFPASLDKVDDFAFYGCRKLTVTNKTATGEPLMKSVRNGAFALTDLRTFWVDDASQSDKGLFRGCDNMRWVVFGGSDGRDIAKYYRENADSRTDGLPKATMVYLPSGVAWPVDYDAARTSLTASDDDWAHANYVYVDQSSGKRLSQFAAFGYSVPKIGITTAPESLDLPLDFTASLAFISRGASEARVQTVVAPMEIPMGRYNTLADDYKDGKAYEFERYDAATGIATFRQVQTLPANIPGLLMDFSQDILANANAHISAFGPTEMTAEKADEALRNANGNTDSKPNGVMLGYYDRQTVPVGAWAYAGSGNTTDDGKAISEGTFFHITKATKSAPLKAVLWLGRDANAKKLVAHFVGDDGETTGVKGVVDIKPARPQGWYTLGGERLAGKPTVRGVYIHEGHKVMIK